MRKLNRLIAGLVLTPMLGACSPMAAQFSKTSDITKKEIPDGPVGPMEKQLQCLDNQPNFLLATEILYFQMTDKYGVKVGVNVPMGILRAIGLGVEYATGDLSTVMHLYNPLNTGISVSDRDGTATSTKIGFDVNFGINIVDLGFSYFTTTSLADLSKRAMLNNIGKLAADVKDEWYTHISKIHDDGSIEIPAGYKAGVQAGDQFAIYPVEWEFLGNGPCSGALKGPRRTAMAPIAMATVAQQPWPSASVLTVKSLDIEKKIAKYDLVMIAKLGASSEPPKCEDHWYGTECEPVAERTKLKRSVRVGPVTGRPILFDTGKGEVKIDITGFAGQQLSTIVSDTLATHGFYKVD